MTSAPAKVYSLTQRSHDGDHGLAGVYSSWEKAVEGAKAFLLRPEESYRWFFYVVSEHDLDVVPQPVYLSGIGAATTREVGYVEWNPRTSTIEISLEQNL